MIAALASNRKPRRAAFGPGDVRTVRGYTATNGERRTAVTFVTGKTVNLGVPVEEVEAALAADSEEILRRAVIRLRADRAEFEAEHPEWQAEFEALGAMDAIFEAAYQQVVREQAES